MKIKFIFFGYLLLMGVIGLSQTDTTRYLCNNCSNNLFSKSKLMKSNKKYFFITYNKNPNKYRDSTKIKDVHCTYCNSHVGYCSQLGEVKILPKSVAKKKDTYVCAICKRPLFKASNLKNKNQETYHFILKNNTAIDIENRSFVINNKHVYCAFCYEFVGVQKKNGKLKIKKNKVH